MSFRPAGFEDDSDDDDFMFENQPLNYKSKQPPGMLTLNTQLSPEDKQYSDSLRKYDTKPVHIRSSPVKPQPDDPLNGRFKATSNGSSKSHGKAKPECLRSNVIPTDDFRMAVMRNNITKVKECLDQGVPVDLVFSTGWTSLMYAASYGKPETLKLLLDNGANPNHDKESLTVLMVACMSSCCNENDVLQCVTYLLDSGAQINAKDRNNDTALLNAAKKGKVSVIQKLLDSGADIDKQDNNGYTSLMWAARHNNLLVISALLEAGADKDCTSTSGEKAADIAFLNGFTKATELLTGKVNHNSDVNGDTSLPMQSPSTQELPSILSHSSPCVNGDSSSGNSLRNGFAEPVNSEMLSSMSKLQGSTTKEVFKHGELEVFLSGLELIDLIPKFRHHNIDFRDFLRMTDDDLIKLGITQMGIRRKILDSIQQTHKTPWQTSSINVIQYNKPITCADSVAMVSNVKKHCAYISSSIGYITDQIKAKPAILTQAEEHCDCGELSIQTEEAITNVRFLFEELNTLRSHLAQVSGTPQYTPADLIISTSGKKSAPWISRRGLILTAILTATVYYNRMTVMDSFRILTDRLLHSK